MLVLDVQRVGRAVERPVARWSGEMSGTIVDFDDLCWDAAASIDDEKWAAQVRDPDGFHCLYDFLWGNSGQIPISRVRRVLWRDMVGRFLEHIDVLH